LVAKEYLEHRRRLATIPSKPEFGTAYAHGKKVIESGIYATPKHGITARAHSVSGDGPTDGKREHMFPARWTLLKAKNTPHHATPNLTKPCC
jgi:hypothetical protein